MTRSEYRDALDALGISLMEAAWFLRIGERTARRYAAGTGIPFTTEMLLNVMVHYRLPMHVVAANCLSPTTENKRYPSLETFLDERRERLNSAQRIRKTRRANKKAVLQKGERPGSR